MPEETKSQPMSKEATGETPLGAENLADLRAVILADRGLAVGIQRRIGADLARLFKLDPALRFQRPIGRVVEPRLGRLHPTNTDLSQKRLDNLKSSCRAAIKYHHDVWPGATYGSGLRDDLLTAYSVIEHIPVAKVVLGPFLRYAQSQAVRLDEISTETLSEYEIYLREVLGQPKSAASIGRVAAHWNKSTRLAGWPRTLLSPEIPVKLIRSIRLKDMGAALRGEFNEYEDFLTRGSLPGKEYDQFDVQEEDENDADRRARPLRPSTIKNRIFTLRRAIGLYAAISGEPVDRIRFADLVVYSNAAAMLREYRTQLGGRETAAGLETMVYAIVLLGRYLQIDERAQRFLDRMARNAIEPKLQAKRSAGISKMTEKNRGLLVQYRQAQITALLQLPSVLMESAGAKVRKGRATPKDMVDAQIACAIAILLHAPIRGGNLASIEIGKHLTLPPTDDCESTLCFDSTEVKNGRKLRHRLPADVTKLLKTYVSDFQPYFERTQGSTMLFPGTDNPCKSVCQMNEQIKKRVEKATGVKTNQHLFRHLCAYMYLRTHPGDYVSLQEMFGHSNIKITMEMYCGPERDGLQDNITLAMRTRKESVGLDPNNMMRVSGNYAKRRRRPEHAA